ncbi:MAG: hypothetical protein GY854_00090 [Deltaproteobacteria bacterium]|nr:hypothetical protein [Deltaproteobacteria bacterium]
MAFDDSGNAIAVWRQAWTSANGGRYGIRSSWYEKSVGWGEDVTVYADTDNMNVSANGPNQVAVDSAGNAWVVWTLYDWSWNHTGVQASRHIGGGQWGAIDTMAIGSASGFGPSVSVDSAGNAIVVWHQSNIEGLYANRHEVGGVWGAPELIETVAREGYARNPKIAFAPDDSALAVWHSNGLPGISFNRYTLTEGWGTSGTVIEVVPPDRMKVSSSYSMMMETLSQSGIGPTVLCMPATMKMGSVGARSTLSKRRWRTTPSR